MNILDPFNPGLALILGIAFTLGGFVAIDKWQEIRVSGLIKARKLEEREAEDRRLEDMITRIVAASFTGRAEADHHFRAEALGKYREALRDALADHSVDERRYIDTLRDKIAEYHSTSMVAVQDARKLAVHISTEYQTIQKKIAEMEKELENLRRDLQEISKRFAA